MGKALGIVYRTIATHLIRKAGYTKTTAHTGAVTPIQRFGSALNLNIHLMCMDARMPRAHGCAGAAHMISLDGVYVDDASSVKKFRWVKAPTSREINSQARNWCNTVANAKPKRALGMSPQAAYLMETRSVAAAASYSTGHTDPLSGGGYPGLCASGYQWLLGARAAVGQEGSRA